MISLLPSFIRIVFIELKPIFFQKISFIRLSYYCHLKGYLGVNCIGIGEFYTIFDSCNYCVLYMSTKLV